MTSENVGGRVRALRKRLGLTHEQVAARGGLRRDEVSKVEGGSNRASTARIREGLATGLGVDPRGFGEYLDGTIEMDALLTPALPPSAPPRQPVQTQAPRIVASDPNPLVRAVLEAYRVEEVSAEDAEAVLALVYTGRSKLAVSGEAEAVTVMRAWLRAARRLRQSGASVTIDALTWELGRTATDARSDALNREGERELAALGATPPAEPVLPRRR